MTHALRSDDEDRLLGAPATTPSTEYITFKILMEKQSKQKPNFRVALCTNRG